MADLSKIKIGYVMTGSFCTFNKSFLQAEELIKSGADLLPVMSYNCLLYTSPSPRDTR